MGHYFLDTQYSSQVTAKSRTSVLKLFYNFHIEFLAAVYQGQTVHRGAKLSANKGKARQTKRLIDNYRQQLLQSENSGTKRKRTYKPIK